MSALAHDATRHFQTFGFYQHDDMPFNELAHPRGRRTSHWRRGSVCLAVDDVREGRGGALRFILKLEQT
eukprot:7574574-Pyramimonas_sp.AAC.1